MKLSAVAAFLVPPRAFVESTKATGLSGVKGATATEAPSNEAVVERKAAIQDTLDFSSEALERLRSDDVTAEQADTSDPIDARKPTSEAAIKSNASLDEGSETAATENSAENSNESSAEGPPSGSTEELSEEQQEQVTELKQRDTEVRAHEQAHVAAGGPHVTGGPTYEYQKGPDGRRYAVGGEVQIDTSPVEGDPEATLQKAQVVRAAALAPAEPSSQDLAVAAAAAQMATQARAELRDPSPASESTGGEPGQASGKSAEGDELKTHVTNTQSYENRTLTNAFAAQERIASVSTIDFYA